MSPSFLNKWDTCLHSNKMVSAGNIDHDHSNISFVNFFFILRKLQTLVWKLIWIFGFSLQVLKFDQFTWTTISSKLYLSPSSLPLKIPACRGHCLVLSSSTLQPCLLCFASVDVEPDCFFILLGIGWFFQFKMFDASIGVQIIFVSNGNNFYTECVCSLQLGVKSLVSSKESSSDGMFSESRRLIHKTITQILLSGWNKQTYFSKLSIMIYLFKVLI